MLKITYSFNGQQVDSLAKAVQLSVAKQMGERIRTLLAPLGSELTQANASINVDPNSLQVSIENLTPELKVKVNKALEALKS